MAQPPGSGQFMANDSARWIEKQKQVYVAQGESDDDAAVHAAAAQPTRAAVPAAVAATTPATGLTTTASTEPPTPTTLGSMNCLEQTVSAAEALSKERNSIKLTRDIATAASSVAQANEALVTHTEYLLQKTEITLEDKQKLTRLLKSQEWAHFFFKSAETQLKRHQGANTQARLVAAQNASMKRSIDVVNGAADGAKSKRV